MSLRVRADAGGAPVQTFKRGQGLDRQELEWPAPHGLNLDHADLRCVLKAPLRRALTEAFTVVVNRRQRTLEYKGARIELALDEGEARRGAQMRPICEVELELRSGSRADLFDLARDLSRAAPLRLSVLGKASQGQLLVHPTPAYRKVTPPPLTRDTTPDEGFLALARQAFVDLAFHAEVYSEFKQGRALHALRVSTRRLKSYLATFSPLLDEAGARAARKHLNWLLQVSAEARNIDVFVETYLTPGPAGELAAAVNAAAVAAHARLQGALASRRFRELLLDLSAWIETEAWQGLTARAIRARLGRIKPFARKALEQGWKVLRRHAADLRTQDPEARHQVRLKIKRLRYVLEPFSPLFTTRGAEGYLTTLRSLQSDLGELNDAVTAEHILTSLKLGDLEADARRLIHIRGEALQTLLPARNRKLKRLMTRLPPWST